MELTPDQQAGLASGEVLLQGVAVVLGPQAVAAANLASTLLNGILAGAAKGEYTQADYDAAVESDNAAKADDLKAQSGG